MKTKNQTEQQHLLELAVAKAANEDGISPPSRDTAASRDQAWSPLEVWRSRVKAPTQSRTESPQIQR
jgi:hypothetical protein